MLLCSTYSLVTSSATTALCAKKLILLLFLFFYLSSTQVLLHLHFTVGQQPNVFNFSASLDHITGCATNCLAIFPRLTQTRPQQRTPTREHSSLIAILLWARVGESSLEIGYLLKLQLIFIHLLGLCKVIQ